jgi:hypothetical protein
MDGYDVCDMTNHEPALRALNPSEYNVLVIGHSVLDE